MDGDYESENSSTYDFFISYTSINRVAVTTLVERLKQDGFKVWFDVEQIVAGHTTLGQLIDGVVASRHMIACLSDPYIDRDWTRYELDTNQTFDPANKRNRTILVKIASLTRKLPEQIQFIPYADLSDPATYDTEYERIVRSVQTDQPEKAPIDPNDRKSLETKVKAALDANNTPISALLQARVAAGALCKFLYRREVREPPTDATLDILTKGLMDRAKLPPPIRMSLNTVITYGTWNVDTADYDITSELVQPGLAALKVIADWTFATYFGTKVEQAPWQVILNALPPAAVTGEYLIPDTDFVLRTPHLSLNSLGPLYAGRNTAWGETVAINLVLLPEEAEGRFNEEVSQFFRLKTSSIMRPLGAGRVVVNNRRLCNYVAVEQVDGANAQELVDRFSALPALAACELTLGVAFALISLHMQEQPIVHGNIKPANVIVDAFGQVKVLCIGRNPRITAEETASGAAEGRIDSFLFASPEQLAGKQLSPRTDLFSLRAMLFHLLTGEYEANVGRERGIGQLSALVLQLLQRLENCQSASSAVEILEDARQQLGGINLRAVSRCYRDNLPLPEELSPHFPRIPPPHIEPPPSDIKLPPPDFALTTEFNIESRGAWALGSHRILVWEAGAGTLAILEGSELVWRDSFAIPIRQIVRGPGTQLAVTSWEGHIRLFADGMPVNVTQLKGGTVGDIQFCAGDWIAGTWLGQLYSLSLTGEVKPVLPEVDKGVFRIAVAGDNDLFAVADLSGGISLYYHRVRNVYIPSNGIVSSMAFAGNRLMIISNQNLYSIMLDGRPGSSERDLTGDRALLLSSPLSGSCLLVSQHGDSWTIDSEGRHLPYFSFANGMQLLSDCTCPKRFVVKLPDGGFAYYWRDKEIQESWPDATSAQLSADGRYLAVSVPGKVLLYEDTRTCRR